MTATTVSVRPLGRREPPDWKHVEKYPYSAVAPRTAKHVEKTLSLPRYASSYDQGSEGACVGFAASWMMSILNRRLYDARWLWDRSKEIDAWSQTNPGDETGTSVRAAMDILRTLGHVRVVRGAERPCDRTEGIQRNRWARSVDEIRTSIDSGTPVVFGTNWYTNFDSPVKKGGAWWVGEGDLGSIRGAHAVCIYRASDRRQAFGFVNNWGEDYPSAWMSYALVERLLAEAAEVALVADR
jgi:hypothetical protein